MPIYELTDSGGQIHRKECHALVSHCVISRSADKDPAPYWCATLQIANKVIASVARAGGRSEVVAVSPMIDEPVVAPPDNMAGAT